MHKSALKQASSWIFGAAVAASLLASCAPAQEEKAAAHLPQSGKPNPKLAGDWELTSGGKSLISLKPDGAMAIDSEAKTPGGVMKSSVTGSWWEEKGVLYMKRKDPEGKDFVSDYTWTLSDKGDLTLTRKGTKSPQQYRKAPAGKK